MKTVRVFALTASDFASERRARQIETKLRNPNGEILSPANERRARQLLALSIESSLKAFDSNIEADEKWLKPTPQISPLALASKLQHTERTQLQRLLGELTTKK